MKYSSAFQCAFSITLLSLLAFLSGCGGGSGGGDNEQEPPSVMVDVTPDAVTLTSAFNVDIDTRVSLGAVTVAGIDAGQMITATITGGEFSVNGENAVTSASVMLADTLEIFGQTSSNFGETTDITFTLGGIAASATIQTVNSPDVTKLHLFQGFTAQSGFEPWVTNGTTAGTRLLAEVNSAGNSNFSHIGQLSGAVYATGTNAEGSIVLFRLGSSGAEPVAEIIGVNEREERNDIGINQLLVHGSRIYIRTTSGVWSSDGTSQGTLKIAAGGTELFSLGDYVYFSRSGSSENLPDNMEDTITGVWRTDGTLEGTTQVASAGSMPRIYPMENYLLVAIQAASNGWNLHRYEQVSGLSDAIASFNVAPFRSVRLNDVLIFTAANDEQGWEIWRTDGTSEGTQILIDLNPGSGDGIRRFSDLQGAHRGDELYFFSDERLNRLFRTDGTSEGTTIEYENSRARRDSSIGRDDVELHLIDGTVLFLGVLNNSGLEILKYDPEVGNVEFLTNINPGRRTGAIRNLTVVNNKLLFMADDSVNGNELWVSDGTEPGTLLLNSFNEGIRGTRFSNFFAHADNIYFLATEAELGARLWQTDGTLAGTLPLAALNIPDVSSVKWLDVLSNTIYFSAYDPSIGDELFALSLADNSVEAATDANDSVNASFDLEEYVAADTFFAFTGRKNTGSEFDERFGDTQLYLSDGTAAGTTLVSINPTGSSSVRSLLTAGSKAYFSADDGEQRSRIWVTEGSPESTQKLNIPFDLPDDAIFTPLAVIEDELFFTVFVDSSDQSNLYKSDGTAEGTILIFDAFDVPGRRLSFRERGGEIFIISEDQSRVTLSQLDTTTGDAQPITNPDFGAYWLSSRCVSFSASVRFEETCPFVVLNQTLYFAGLNFDGDAHLLSKDLGQLEFNSALPLALSSTTSRPNFSIWLVATDEYLYFRLPTGSARAEVQSEKVGRGIEIVTEPRSRRFVLYRWKPGLEQAEEVSGIINDEFSYQVSTLHTLGNTLVFVRQIDICEQPGEQCTVQYQLWSRTDAGVEAQLATHDRPLEFDAKVDGKLYFTSRRFDSQVITETRWATDGTVEGTAIYREQVLPR